MTDPEADAAFRAYFRAERPTPWPWSRRETPAVPSSFRVVPRRSHARLTLAASVALALGVGLAFTPTPAPPPVAVQAADPLAGAMADGKSIIRDVKLDPVGVSKRGGK